MIPWCIIVMEHIVFKQVLLQTFMSPSQTYFIFISYVLAVCVSDEAAAEEWLWWLQ